MIAFLLIGVLFKVSVIKCKKIYCMEIVFWYKYTVSPSRRWFCQEILFENWEIVNANEKQIPTRIWWWDEQASCLNRSAVQGLGCQVWEDGGEGWNHLAVDLYKMVSYSAQNGYHSPTNTNTNTTIHTNTNTVTVVKAETTWWLICTRWFHTVHKMVITLLQIQI